MSSGSGSWPCGAFVLGGAAFLWSSLGLHAPLPSPQIVTTSAAFQKSSVFESLISLPFTTPSEDHDDLRFHVSFGMLFRVATVRHKSL